ncbi:hypothetical protein MR642_09640 [bacterium]|nr:hypothetical protein [bacterium]
MIYPVLVIYKIRLQDSIAYNTLLRPNGIDDFLIYDNSPASFEQDLSQVPHKACYQRDYSNSGLPKAYNCGATMAVQKGYSHILLLDQDSKFPLETWDCYLRHLDFPGIVSPMFKTKEGLNFSPVYIGGLLPRAERDLHGGEYSLYSHAVINSGCCIPVGLFEQAGGYDPRVRLDFADFQFQLRVRAIRPRLLVLDVVAEQDFSNDVVDVRALRSRFKLYLESALHFRSDSVKGKLKHHYAVFHHTLSLFFRTRSLSFLTDYVKFLLGG